MVIWYSDLSPVSLNMTFAPRNYLLLLAATSVSTLSTSQQEIYYHTEITNARGIFIILFSYFDFVVARAGLASFLCIAARRFMKIL